MQDDFTGQSGKACDSVVKDAYLTWCNDKSDTNMNKYLSSIKNNL